MVAEPVAHVPFGGGAAARAAGATLVAGHSAHVFHGVVDRVVYDLGDFIDDYARDPYLRNELGLLWLVTFNNCRRGQGFEVVPLALDYCRTPTRRPRQSRVDCEPLPSAACAAVGTDVEEHAGRLVVEWARGDEPQRTATSASPRLTAAELEAASLNASQSPSMR